AGRTCRRLQHRRAEVEVGTGLDQHATELAAAQYAEGEILIEGLHVVQRVRVTGKRGILPFPEGCRHMRRVHRLSSCCSKRRASSWPASSSSARYKSARASAPRSISASVCARRKWTSACWGMISRDKAKHSSAWST